MKDNLSVATTDGWVIFFDKIIGYRITEGGNIIIATTSQSTHTVDLDSVDDFKQYVQRSPVV